MNTVKMDYRWYNPDPAYNYYYTVLCPHNKALEVCS